MAEELVSFGLRGFIEPTIGPRCELTIPFGKEEKRGTVLGDVSPLTAPDAGRPLRRMLRHRSSVEARALLCRWSRVSVDHRRFRPRKSGSQGQLSRLSSAINNGQVDGVEAERGIDVPG